MAFFFFCFSLFSVLRHSQIRQLRSSGTRRSRVLRLDEHLLEALLALVEEFVDLLHVLEPDSVTDHVKRVDLVLADELQEVVPVLVDGGLAITDQTDTGLHQSADVEVVGLVVELVCVMACNSKGRKNGVYVRNQRTLQ